MKQYQWDQLSSISGKQQAEERSNRLGESVVVLEDGNCVEWEFIPLAYFDVFSKCLKIDVNTFTHTNVDVISSCLRHFLASFSL